MASSAHQLFLLAFAFAAIATRGADAWGDRLFFSKTTRPQAIESEKAATSTSTVVPEAADPNSVPAFSRPSSGSTRGYGLYGRPEENHPPAYFRRGVHRDAEKLTTTTNVPTAPEEEEAVSVEAGREGAEPSYADSGSGWGRPMSYADNGSGRGRPLSYAGTRGRQQQRYGMSDPRLYQNGRYYYDVDTGKYGYGYESNPVPEESGSGYDRAGERRGRYGNAAGYEYANGNGVAGNQNGFQENQNGQYNP